MTRQDAGWRPIKMKNNVSKWKRLARHQAS